MTRVALVDLPRWFAAPAVVLVVLLGAHIGGANPLQSALAVLAGLATMAAAHSYNSWHDYVITGFDRGPVGGRSNPKPYTAGQSAIALGLATPGQVLLVAFAWALAALFLGAILAFSSSPWVLVPIAVSLACAPWYSTAKRLFHPEVPLCIGFAWMASLLGYFAGGETREWLKAILVSMPFFFLWAAAEHIDQAYDAPSDWPKGGRSLGMLYAVKGIPLKWPILGLVAAAYASQAALIAAGYLRTGTALTLLALVPTGFCLALLDKKMDRAIPWGLGAIVLFLISLVVPEMVRLW